MSKSVTYTRKDTNEVPSEVIEMARWMDAVSARVAERQDDIAKKWTELRGEDGLVGGTARLLLHGDHPTPDADMLAGSIQDVQIALLAPSGQLGLHITLPQMAERAWQARGAEAFLEAASRYHGQPIPFAGIQSTALPLLIQTNELLRAHGLQPNLGLEAAAAHNGPTLLSQMLARVCKRRVRQLLFTTVLGAATAQPGHGRLPAKPARSLKAAVTIG